MWDRSPLLTAVSYNIEQPSLLLQRRTGHGYTRMDGRTCDDGYRLIRELFIDIVHVLSQRILQIFTSIRNLRHRPLARNVALVAGVTTNNDPRRKST